MPHHTKHTASVRTLTALGMALLCISIPMLAACKDIKDAVPGATLAQVSQTSTPGVVAAPLTATGTGNAAPPPVSRTEGVTLAVEGANCRIEATRYFGNACFAAAKTRLVHGATAVFPNVRPGYRGSTQAQCIGGVVHWTEEHCRPGPLLGQGDARTATTHSLDGAPGSQMPTADYQIGVYYFGGWKDNQLGAPATKPWERLLQYPDREPLLGYYAEDTKGVMGQQLQWMRQHGIDFVVFNWYWSRNNTPVLDHAVRAYLATTNKPAVKFAVQWSNHETYNYTAAQLDAMFRFWIDNYFKRPEYHTYAGKPAIYIFLGGYWARNAAAIGMTSAQLVDRLDSLAKAAGLPGVSVIGGHWGGDKSLDYGPSSGFAALTMYNYHSPAGITLLPRRAGNYSRSYAELHQAYASQWDWMIRNTTQNFIVPMTPGWDKRPWGGSEDPLHDDSRSVPSEFALHLQAARAFMDSHPGRTQRTGLICCWNEFGEGSFVEPTKVDQFNYLQAIGATFGRP